MSCSTPEVSKALSEQIGAAKDKLASLTADADKGIAAALGSLNADLAAEKEKLTAKLGDMVPEVELPKANLQADLTAMMDSLDDPGAMASKFAELKKNFGGAPGINLDSILDGIGLDAAKLNSIDEKLAGALKSGSDLLNDATGALDGALGGAADALKGAASGLVGDIKGAIPGLDSDIGLPGVDLSAAKDAICGKVPNLDLDKDGEVVKKGLPATQPTKEAEKPAPKAETKKEVTPVATSQADHVIERSDLRMHHFHKLSLEEMEAYNKLKESYRKTKVKSNKPIIKELKPLVRSLKKQKRKGEPIDKADLQRYKGLKACYTWIIKDMLTVQSADPKLNFGLKLEEEVVRERELEWSSTFPTRAAMDQYMYGQADLSAYLLSKVQHTWPPFSE
jgi:hypothetical protein